MNPKLLFVGLCLLSLSACHRPYALYRPSVSPRFATAPVPVSTPPLPDSTLTNPAVMEPVMLASARPEAPLSVTNRLPTHTRHVTGWTKAITTEKAKNQADVGQPKPRKTAPARRRTLREMLGLKPRPELNWWQRIRWQLKASVIVILVAVVFAVLNITVLAIIFGVLGAVLLLQGLKKTLKVRRPWF